MMNSPVTRDKIRIWEGKPASRGQSSTVTIRLSYCPNVGEPLEGPAQSPVKSTKDILISSYGSDPNFINYVLSTIFNPDRYAQSKSLQKIFLNAD